MQGEIIQSIQSETLFFQQTQCGLTQPRSKHPRKDIFLDKINGLAGRFEPDSAIVMACMSRLPEALAIANRLRKNKGISQAHGFDHLNRHQFVVLPLKLDNHPLEA